MAGLEPSGKLDGAPHSRSALLARLWGAARGPGLVGVLSRGAGAGLLTFIAGVLAAMLAQLVLARILGVDGFGVYAYSLSLLALASMVARLGMDTGLVRFAAAYRVGHRWAELRGLLRFADRWVATVGVGLGLAGAGATWLIGDRLDPELRHTLLIACALVPVVALLGLRTGAMQGLRRVAVGRVPELLVRPLFVAVLAFAFHRWVGALTPSMAMVGNFASTLLAVVAGSLLVRWAWPAPPQATTVEPIFHGRQWLRVSLPLLLVTGMRRLLTETDILLVGAMLGTTTAGIYAVASRLSRLIAFGHNAGNMISAPLIAELHSQGEMARLQRMVTLATWGSTLSAAAAALALTALGGWVLRLFGAEFAVGLPILAVLCLGQVVNAATGPVGHLLNMTGLQDTNARILMVVTGLNLLLNYPAIRAFGPLGAAVTTAAMIGLKNGWTWFAVRRSLGINSSIFGGLKG